MHQRGDGAEGKNVVVWSNPSCRGWDAGVSFSVMLQLTLGVPWCGWGHPHGCDSQTESPSISGLSPSLQPLGDLKGLVQQLGRQLGEEREQMISGEVCSWKRHASLSFTFPLPEFSHMDIPHAGKAGKCQPVGQIGQGRWFVEHSPTSATSESPHKPDVILYLRPSRNLAAHLGGDQVIGRIPHLCLRQIKLPLNQYIRTLHL